EIVDAYPVRRLELDGRGPGAARNAGWRVSSTPLIWFIDSDCVPEGDALALLLPHLEDRRVAAVGGSYGNMRPDSTLACLIHEEIIERHLRMPAEVDVLGSFNVLYRREALEAVRGFDERFLLAQDAELAYRVVAAGHRLRMEPRSRVKHHHPTRLLPYLRTQARQGFWRVMLYRAHPSGVSGDAYSATVDHAQPPLAAVSLGLLASAPFGPPSVRPMSALALAALAALQLPMTIRLLRRTRAITYVWFAPLGWLRAFARCLGLAAGVGSAIAAGVRRAKST
ncbi:MAG: glycosyltransferase, partial [Gemmatimonadetes bacterium]|nr:glycosyltransferase [Gemmatimonadota bacterium]